MINYTLSIGFSPPLPICFFALDQIERQPTLACHNGSFKASDIAKYLRLFANTT